MNAKVIRDCGHAIESVRLQNEILWEIRAFLLTVSTVFESYLCFQWSGSSDNNLCMSMFTAACGAKASFVTGKEEAFASSL